MCFWLFKIILSSDHGGTVGGFVLPGRGKGLNALVVAGEAVDAGFDENEAELGAGVTAVLVEVLAHVDGALDEAVEIFRKVGGLTVVLQDTEDLAASDGLDLSDTHRVTEFSTDHGGRDTLLGLLDDGLDEVAGGLLEPGGRGAAEGESRGSLALAGTVHADHVLEKGFCFCGFLFFLFEEKKKRL